MICEMPPSEVTTRVSYPALLAAPGPARREGSDEALRLDAKCT